MLKIVGGLDAPAPVPRVAIIIPARFGSTRFPGKPLAPLRGAEGHVKSLIQRSWEAASAVDGAAETWIATDDPRIAQEAERFGGRVVLTPAECRNGTERCWAALCIADIDADIIVNLQGDSPLTPPLAIDLLIDTLRADATIEIATPMVRCTPLQIDLLTAEARRDRAGGTTVVFDSAMNALYFSKRVIPYVPQRAFEPPVFMHLGLYAYRRDTLARYAEIEPSPLERAEGLEQLRFLQAGIPVRVVEVPAPPGGLWEVNNPADVVIVEAALTERRLA